MARRTKWNKYEKISSTITNNKIASKGTPTKKEGYKIGVIERKGGIISYDVTTKDEMETKVLEIMDEGNYKKILVLNRRTKQRKTYLP